MDPEQVIASAEAMFGCTDEWTEKITSDIRRVAGKFMSPDFSFFVTEIVAYIEYDTSGNVSQEAAFYEYVSDVDAGAFLFSSEEVTQTSITATKWVTFTLTNPQEIDASTNYFIAIMGDVNDDYWIRKKSDNGKTVVDYGSGSWPDPFLEDLTYNDELCIYVNGYIIKNTEVNEYYGSETEYVAIRNFSFNFPTGCSNKEYVVKFPITENFVNLTVGSSKITSGYTIDEFNVTHQKITISDSVVENEMTLCTKSYDHIYTLHGLYCENGTRVGSIEITASREEDSKEYTVNGTIILGFEDPVIQFSWELEGGGMHYIHPVSDIETFYITTPDDIYSSYAFIIKDYSGSIGSQDSYLEALRMINGTERLVERMMIWDTTNTVPLTLTLSKIYALQVRTPNGVTRFPYFIPSGNTAPILTITGMEFSDQVHYVGEHIAVEATRVNATYIQINYNDTLLQTTSVFVEAINIKTGIQAWNDTATENTIQFNWYGATNTTDYLVKLEAYHEFYGKITYSKVLQGSKEPLDDLPDFDSFLGPGAQNGFSVLVIFIAVFGFSRTSALFGVFIGVATAYALTYIGLLDVPYLPIHAALTLTILWGLSGGGQR